MKLKGCSVKKLVVVGALLLALAGCDDVKPDHAAITIQVAPQQEVCTGITQQRCFRVKPAGADAWQLYYGKISGFNYQPGFLYELKVKQKHAKPSDANVSRLEWELVSVLSKHAVAADTAASSQDAAADK